MLFSTYSFSEDYNYDFFSDRNESSLPFSDYIPRVRLHYKTTPHYVEDFYELYGKKLYYNENTLRKNIERLKTALMCRFRHPSQSLVKTHSKEEYLKYRRLLSMHINLLIMRNHMRIASRYDMNNIYFHSGSFAEEILESFKTAEKIYREAIPYWNQARDLAEKASEIKISTDLSQMESERYSIIRKELDYGQIISKHIDKLVEKKAKLTELKNTVSSR